MKRVLVCNYVIHNNSIRHMMYFSTFLLLQILWFVLCVCLLQYLIVYSITLFTIRRNDKKIKKKIIKQNKKKTNK